MTTQAAVGKQEKLPTKRNSRIKGSREKRTTRRERKEYPDKKTYWRDSWELNDPAGTKKILTIIVRA